MSTIRPLRAQDLPQVVSLYEIRRSGGREAPAGMEAHFQRLFLDGPTVDPEIPSLVVAKEDGGVAGFLGSNVRTMRFDGRPVRMAATGPLFTEPSARALATFLLRQYVAGPQDFTITDRQNLDAHRLFVRIGAAVSHLRCLWWTVVFRPFELRAARLTRPKHRAALRPAARTVARTLDLLAARLRPSARAGSPPASTEPLTPAALAESFEAISSWARLRPGYDEPFLDWTFAELRKARRLGVFTPVLVREEMGGVLGWYIYFLKPGGVARVLQLVAKPGYEEGVLRSLVDHAREGGAAALTGRLEPELMMALRSLRCRLDQGACLLVHTARDDIREAIASEGALLTLFDGEAWVAETFDG